MRYGIAVIAPILGFLALALTGCAVDRGPLTFPDPMALVSPSPGMAVVYLLRVPGEPVEVQVLVNGERVAKLARGTFTAIALAPGRYELLALEPDVSMPSTASALTLVAGDRRFLYTAVPTRGTEGFGLAPLAGAVVPVLKAGQVAIGARRWTALSEFDAQGLFSVLKPVGAELYAP
ncbi:hypothetical protein KAK06_19110 [Ideonella sp. 4Y11]|uniref:DUF2846 domain-containing protein n=1 Tax=Ideonella aquatica TaxID=2824119 RepID=A0A940YSF6_9BURK|nr:hypothetical protein [Ideonella aquatica]MBQ0961073.1 hypothetical protein [Ideonella aquatica]